MKYVRKGRNNTKIQVLQINAYDMQRFLDSLNKSLLYVTDKLE